VATLLASNLQPPKLLRRHGRVRALRGMGMSAMPAHGGAHMASFMPEPMRVIGLAMHRAASRFAVSARDAEVTGDLSAAFGALSQVMQQCVACHEGFRVH
jgi:hypothetical protein